MDARVEQLNHPLVRHHLKALRDASSPPAVFREQVRRLSVLLAVEASRDLPLINQDVATPMETTTVQQLRGRLALIPILRAGLGMVPAMLDMLPEAEVWHLGMYRDESTSLPIEYYCKLPDHDPADVAWILDPMLATGGSICMALDILKRWGVRDIRILSLLGTPEGIAQVHRQHPEVRIWVASIDRKLNAANYILPGLGDAGDRQFNTLIR